MDLLAILCPMPVAIFILQYWRLAALFQREISFFGKGFHIIAPAELKIQKFSYFSHHQLNQNLCI
jgi:hypothetical protein